MTYTLLTQDMSRYERTTYLYCSVPDLTVLAITLLNFDMAFRRSDHRGATPACDPQRADHGLPVEEFAPDGQVSAAACTEALAAYQVVVEAESPVPPAYLVGVVVPFLRIAAQHVGFWVCASPIGAILRAQHTSLLTVEH